MATWQFKHPREHYAALFKVSARTISRYAKAGFPLDDESATRLLLSTGGNPAPPTLANGPRIARPGISGDIGLSAALGRLEAEEAEAYASYRQAVERGDANAAEARRKQWMGINEQLRKAAVSSPEVAEANKRLISQDEVSNALTELFVIHRQDLENLGKRVAAELVGKDEISIREAINRETTVLIHSLYSCSYLGGNGND
jgi:hypothetical protein